MTISTGGREQVVRLLGEEMEQRGDRPRRPEIAPLRRAVQRQLDQDRELMESLRETAVLTLASEKLEAAQDQHRNQQASDLVNKYSRRAMIGALAAVAPGSDLVIQGVLATRLIRELSKLYDIPVKEIEIESFLEQAGGKVRNMTAITLAIAGNAFKAFPGLGTVTGGVIHAVAYGMIFDSLGNAVAETMASRGALRPYPAAEAFEDLLHDHLESGAVRFAQLAISRPEREGRRERLNPTGTCWKPTSISRISCWIQAYLLQSRLSFPPSLRKLKPFPENSTRKKSILLLLAGLASASLHC